MFCILPFEVDFYRKWDMEVDYVGNPLLDAISAFTPDADFVMSNHLSDKPIIALLPGSRKQEINYLLPTMLAGSKNFPEYQFVIAGAPSFQAKYYDRFFNAGEKVPVIFNATYNLLHHAQAAIVASGTATLETALFHVPQVVVYKGNKVTIGIARVLIKIGFISLVNLIMDRLIVKELIQGDYTTETATAELKLLMQDKAYRDEMLHNYALLDERMGKPGASAKTASLIIKYITKK